MIKEIQHLPPYKNFTIDVLRLDLIHPYYGGNKYFKLKYNVIKAVEGHAERSRSTPSTIDVTLSGVEGRHSILPILTFGGAHSNHIYSTAAFCHEHKLKVIGVIRGESSLIEQSPTLQFAQKQGMHLHFISRERYKNKTDNDFIEELKQEFGNFYMIPEGGNNELGIKGCMEILDQVPFYDYVFCACGTACTYIGILASAKPTQKIIGVSVLKGENALINDVNENASKFNFTPIKPFSGDKLLYSTILDQYHFGGYAKHSNELLNFKKAFEAEHHMPLDYVYTSKLVYAVYDLINKGQLIDNSSVLIVHSGGQQGNAGYEKRYNLNA
jgi:1-aminocyclopropane-1-carboxylate deaminase